MKIELLKKGDKFYKVYGVSVFGIDLEEVSISECECVNARSWSEHCDYLDEDVIEFDITYNEKYEDGRVRLKRVSSEKGGAYELGYVFPTLDEASDCIRAKANELVRGYEAKLYRYRQLLDSLPKSEKEIGD